MKDPAPFCPETGDLQLIVETPKGSRNKFTWDEELNRFRLTKVLPQGHVFPFDFGYIPGTRGQDGDPLDVLLLTDEPVGLPGCLVSSRLVGVIEAEQTSKGGATVRNDRLLAVATVSHAFQDIRQLDDLPPHLLREVESFFVSYNQQRGKEFRPLGRGSAERAKKLVSSARVQKPV